MMPRSQIAALAVLLVGLGVVLALVGTTGVSTGVFSTSTPVPTATPSPTPLPEASGDNWASSAPGQLTYTADPNINAQIVYQIAASVDELVGLTGLNAPAADDPDPLLALLTEIRDELASQVEASQLTLAPDAFTDPAVEIIGYLPVASMRLQVGTQITTAGQEFSGLDLVQMFIQHPDGQVTYLQYVLRGAPDPVVYADFRAWLRDNIADIVAPASDVSPEGTPEATEPATTPEATEEVTPEAAATEESTAETTEATPTEEVTPEATEESTTEVVTPEAAEAATPAEKWLEISPGQVMYAANPSAFIQYTAAPLDEFAVSMGMEVGDTPPSAEDILNAVRTRLETQLAEGAITVEEGDFVGPVAEEIEGVTFSYLHLTLLPQTSADGQTRSAEDIVMGVIMTGENRLTAIQFIYQGEPDSAIYEDFREWLAQNITRLAELEITAETPPVATAEPTVEPTAEGSGE